MQENHMNQSLEGRKWPQNECKEKEMSISNSRTQSFRNISIGSKIGTNDQLKSGIVFDRKPNKSLSLDHSLRHQMKDQEKKTITRKEWFPCDLQLNLSLGLNNNNNINDHKSCSKGGEPDINTKLSLAFTPHSSTAN
ncbi:mitochondrial ATP synthase D chain-related protein [Striga asiatica]|uniref:Mitochondrial ATP synthase D chain-related protein n=1 Tax=Striga asiatica TaxID=4170 RepID=A0A5A7NW37_STRAF|nr:mitochondrial ATP synthase D chain-related protein [Striga asiatica]